MQRYIDGALSNNLPFADCPRTITVSPFTGTVDICPPSTSANMQELNAFNASFQISTRNLLLAFLCLASPSSEVGRPWRQPGSGESLGPDRGPCAGLRVPEPFPEPQSRSRTHSRKAPPEQV